MAAEVRQGQRSDDSFSRRAWPRIALFATALVVLAIVAVLYVDELRREPPSPLVCADDAASARSALFAGAMTDVALVSMERAPVMLSELAGERFTVAVFCSYKCPCSDGYVDRLRALQDRYVARGVAFVGMHASADETLDGMTRYIQRTKYPLPVYRDDTGVAADAMQATVTPEVFVFDHTWRLRYQGRIDDDKSGIAVTEESLRLALDTLLAGQELWEREKTSLGCAIVRAE
jgi:hypothetical protein